MEKTHTAFEGLPAEWRKRAEYLRAHGDATSAKLWTLAADELEQSIAAHGLETLSLIETSKLSGYTPDHLGQLVRSGRIRNYGREGAPRIRRADLPIKKAGGAGRPVKAEPESSERERQLVRSVAQSFGRKSR